MDNRARGNVKWWSEELRDDPAQVIHSLLDSGSLVAHHTAMRQAAYRNAKATDIDPTSMGLSAGQAATTTDASSAQDPESQYSYNIVNSAAKTIAAVMCAQKVLPMAITSGGTWKEQHSAKEFNRAIGALFDQANVFKQLHQWCMDSLRWPAGVAKITCDGEGVIAERCFAFDIFVDPLEARMGWTGVRTLYHRFRVDVEALCTRLDDEGIDEEIISKIRNAPPSSSEDDGLYQTDSVSDMVVLTEAYHLPSGPKAKDGRYARVVRGVTISSEEWSKSSFPFAFLYQEKPGMGVWPVPFVTRYLGAQALFDKYSIRINKAMDRLGVPHVLFPENSGDITVDNSEGVSVIHYPGNIPPREWNAQPIHPDVIAQRNAIPGEILQREGIPEMWATGQMPDWLHNSSGKAQQVYVDEGSKRFAPTEQCLQEFLLDIGEKILDCARELASDNSGWVVQAQDGKTLKEYKFSEIDLGVGKYKLIVQPVSALSKNPSAHYDQLKELQEAGMLPRGAYLQLLGVPDIEGATDMASSAYDLVMRNIYQIMTTGKKRTAIPTDPLDMIIKLGDDAYNKGQVDEEPQEYLDALLSYTMSAFDLRQKQKAAAQPPPAPPGAMPPPPMPGAPMPPPMPPPGMPTDAGPMPTDMPIPGGAPPLAA